MPMLEGKLIICDSNIPWHHNRYSKHHLMSRLARTNDVVFMDPEEEWGAYLRRPRGQRGSLARRTWQPEGEDLTVFTPLWLPGRARADFVRRWDEPYLVRQVRRVVRRHAGQDLILFLGNAWHVFLLDAFPEAACTIYHCSDNFPAMFEGDFRRRFEEREEEMVRRADLVVCPNPLLVEKCRSIGGNACCLEHAVDERVLRPMGIAPPAIPDELAGLPRPLIGLVAWIDHIIDYDLLREVARRLPYASLVLVGPVSESCRPDLDQLLECGNVKWLGPRPWTQIPEYLWSLDVGIIPFRVNAVTSGGSPLKLFEYLAAGLPVVSTCAPLAERLAPYVAVAADADGFADAVAEAAREGRGRMAPRVALIRDEYTWDRRVEELSEAIQRHLDRPRGR